MPLFAGHSIGIAVVSYHGQMVFGLNADRMAAPDVGVLRGGHRALVRRAAPTGGKAVAPPGGRGRELRPDTAESPVGAALRRPKRERPSPSARQRADGVADELGGDDEAHLVKTQVKDELSLLTPRPATIDEIAAVHDRDYINSLKCEIESGGGWLDPDTYVSRGSWEAALYAAGGLMNAVDAVMNKKVDSAFALVRPPGHHAVRLHQMGFCLFNNVAIAAKFALKNFDIKRVLIIDFDVHHGNGTQEAFYSDPQVLYFSTHEYPWYPFTGSAEETGKGRGRIQRKRPAGSRPGRQGVPAGLQRDTDAHGASATSRTWYWSRRATTPTGRTPSPT